MGDLKVSSETVNGYLVVKLVGEMSCFNSSIFTDAVEEAITVKGQHQIVIDASDLDFVDSCGVGAMVSIQKKVSADGGFVHIAGAQAGLLETLTITRLTKLFPIFGTVEEALREPSEEPGNTVGLADGGSISSTIIHQFLVIKMSGDISEKEIPQAKQEFLKFGDSSTSNGLILNIAGLGNLDAAGMTFIQDAGAQARRSGGRSILVGTTSKMLHLLNSAKINHQFEFSDDISDVPAKPLT